MTELTEDTAALLEEMARLRDQLERMEDASANGSAVGQAVTMDDPWLALRHLPALLLAFDQAANLVFWNRECERVCGRGQAEMLGNPNWPGLLCPDPAEAQALRQALARPDGDYRDLELPIVGGDGVRRTIAWSGVSRPAAGWAAWAVGVDVSGRKNAEDALRLSEQNSRLMIDSAMEGVNVAQDGLFRYVNQALGDMLGHEPGELLGRRFDEMIHPDDISLVLERHYTRLRGGSPPSIYPFRIVTKDGHVRWAELRTVLITWEGRPATLNFMRDITRRRAAELALREEERRYQALSDATFEAVFIVQDDRCIDANKTALTLFGHAYDQLIGLDFAALFAPAADQSIRRYLRSGDADPLEVEARRRDGSTFWAEVCCRPASYRGQAVSIGAVRDVTGQKMAEAELRRSEATIRGILNAAPIGIGLVGGKDRLLGWSNKALSQMTGYSPRELEGMPARRLYPSEEEYLRVGREKNEKALVGPVGSLETTWLRKDGGVFDIVLSAALVDPHDLQGSLVFTVLDITQRKQAESALRENEQRLRKIVESLPMGAVLREGDRLFANKAVEDITGWDRSELATVDQWFQKVHGPRADEMLAQYQQMRDIGVPVRLTMLGQHRNGESRVLELATSQEWGGELWLIRDVTDEQRAMEDKAKLEAQLRHAQKMEALGTLAGGIAHDFNNILAAIIGFTELALEGHQEGQFNAGDLEQVLRSAERARELVRQILAFSRQTEAELRPVDLNQHVRQAMDLLRCTLPKMIGLESKLADDLRPVLANANQLEQMILNLAGNAKDAMPDGGRLVLETENTYLDEDYCQAHVGLVPGPYVLLKVADTGHGMDQQTLLRMYDPFFTTKEVGKGTGLGMSTVYGVVKGHRGHISCYSEPGRGTVFRIFLPANQDASLPEADDEAKRQMEITGDETVLLVDDEPALLEVGGKMLARQGYHVRTAASGEEALAIYQAQAAEIDLVILDVSMPGMGGHACLQRLLLLDPEVKVIIASGYSREAHLTDIVADGAAGYVAKPFRRHDLLALVRQVLDDAAGVHGQRQGNS